MCGHDGAIFETSKNEPFVFRISTPQSVRFSRALGLIEWSKFVFQSTLVTRNTNCSNFKPIPRLDEIRPFELRNGNHKRITNALRPRHSTTSYFEIQLLFEIQQSRSWLPLTSQAYKGSYSGRAAAPNRSHAAQPGAGWVAASAALSVASIPATTVQVQ